MKKITIILLVLIGYLKAFNQHLDQYSTDSIIAIAKKLILLNPDSALNLLDVSKQQASEENDLANILYNIFIKR